MAQGCVLAWKQCQKYLQITGHKTSAAAAVGVVDTCVLYLSLSCWQSINNL